MTTPLVPDFVINMFENELRGIIMTVIDTLSKDFSIDREVAIKKVQRKLGMSLTIVKEDEEVIRIIKAKPRKVPNEHQRCLARVAKNGMLDQCSFQKLSKSDFCKRHACNHAKYGIVGDPEIELPVQNPHKKYYKIY